MNTKIIWFDNFWIEAKNRLFKNGILKLIQNISLLFLGIFKQQNQKKLVRIYTNLN